MLKKDLIAIRPMIESDRNFIYSTWLDGIYYGNEIFKLIDKPVFKNKYKKIIYEIMARPDILMTIACLKDDPEIILGYSVSQKSTLHFIYVKAAWRNIGIAKDLLPKDWDSISIYSSITDIGRGILGQKCNNIRVNLL